MNTNLHTYMLMSDKHNHIIKLLITIKKTYKLYANWFYKNLSQTLLNLWSILL